MSIVETVLVFAGIPIGVFALMALIVLGPGAARAPRYRPGGEWDYHPVWYLPHPAVTSQLAPLDSSRQLEAGHHNLVLDDSTTPSKTSASGGASGGW